MPAARDLELDRLPAERAALEVGELRDARFGEAAAGARAPHRHDYHELLWTREGEGLHLVDGEPHPVVPGTLLLIGRGRVHVLERAQGFTGAVVRFGDELLHDGAGTSWLLEGRGPRTVHVPPSAAPALDALVRALGDEARRPPDARSPALQRHLLSVLLLWAERWWDDARTERRDPDGAAERLHRRFVALLERDFARHHDAAHYAEALRVPAAALAHALAQATGRTTKELVTDRVMTEAARLLRFTDLSVGEIAFRIGFRDQLYFSRAFKRHHGEPPVRWRERARGLG